MRLSLISLFTLVFILFSPLVIALAQDAPAVQEVYGSLAVGEIEIFVLQDLKQEQTLTAFLENTSGNLDPFLAVIPASNSLSEMLASYQKDLQDLIANSPQPLLDLPALRDEYLLAWDDDSGPGYTAALNFTIPATGDYLLLVGSSLSSAGRQTAGNYRLLVGIDAPEVLMGTAAPTGAQIAVQNQAALPSQLVQEMTGALGKDMPSISININHLNPGDILYVQLEATSGDLKPIIFLRDYGDKPIMVANLNGQASTASFQQTFPEGGTNYYLELQAAEQSGQFTSGDFRLTVGLNATVCPGRSGPA